MKLRLGEMIYENLGIAEDVSQEINFYFLAFVFFNSPIIVFISRCFKGFRNRFPIKNWKQITDNRIVASVCGVSEKIDLRK